MTNGEGIAPEVREFLRRTIRTYEQLEVLLLLRAEPDRVWAANELAERLNVPIPEAREALEHLRQAGLVHGSFHYAPATPELAGIVDLLAIAYDSYRVGVMNLMNANAIARVRNDSLLHVFADAFVIGGKKGKEDKEDG